MREVHAKNHLKIRFYESFRNTSFGHKIIIYYTLVFTSFGQKNQIKSRIVQNATKLIRSFLYAMREGYDEIP